MKNLNSICIEPDLIKLGDQRPEGVREIVDGIPVPESDPFYGNFPEGLIPSWNER